MHEERQVSQGYRDMFPDSAPPPRSMHTNQPYNHPCQLPPQHCCHSSQHCHLSTPKCRTPPNCCHKEGNTVCSSDHQQSNDGLKVLEAAVDKLRDEIVDIVNSIEKLDTRTKTICIKSTKPVYQNPQQIPNFEQLEEVIDIDLGTDKDEDDAESVVSMDEFVPDDVLHPPSARSPEISTPLNY